MKTWLNGGNATFPRMGEKVYFFCFVSCLLSYLIVNAADRTLSLQLSGAKIIIKRHGNLGVSIRTGYRAITHSFINI